MKNVDYVSYFKDFLTSALTALVTALTSILWAYFTVSGGIDYSITEDKTAYLISIVIANENTEPASVEIGMPVTIEGIVSTSGLSGIEIQNPTGRIGSILSITKIPPTSEYAAIVRCQKVVTVPTPILVSAPAGMKLRRANPIRDRINLPQILTNAALYFVIYFIMLIFITNYRNKMRIEFTDKYEEAKKQRDELDDQITEVRSSADNLEIRYRRAKLYLLSHVRYLKAENEFWRIAVERLLVTGGSTRVMARRLLDIVARRFGHASSADNITDENLDFVIDVLIDEEKRKRFDDLNK